MTFAEIFVVFICFFVAVSSILVDYFTHSKLHKRVEQLESDVKTLLKGDSDVR